MPEIDSTTGLAKLPKDYYFRLSTEKSNGAIVYVTIQILRRRTRWTLPILDKRIAYDTGRLYHLDTDAIARLSQEVASTARWEGKLLSVEEREARKLKHAKYKADSKANVKEIMSIRGNYPPRKLSK